MSLLPEDSRLASALRELAVVASTELAAVQDRARRETATELNQAIRRILRSETEEEWAEALVAATVRFAANAALFRLEGRTLKPLRARGAVRPLPQELPLGVAPALAAAVESSDTVVALPAASEISQNLEHLFGESAERCYVFPIAARDRVRALLYVEGSAADPDALEAVAAAASSAPALLKERPLPAEHLRAQRFARVRVAQMRLYKSEAVRAGRAGRALYVRLRDDIEAGRAAFRREFLTGNTAMPDYFHRELVGTLANDDATLLGDDYPGPLA